MKATDVIKRDHRAAKELFEQFKKANKEEREKMESKIFEALTAHERMEDKFFYPEIKKKLKDENIFGELEKEQKALEIEVLAARAIPGDRAERIIKMIDTVLAHAEKEETKIFPLVEKECTATQLEDMGREMEPHSAVANAK